MRSITGDSLLNSRIFNEAAISQKDMEAIPADWINTLPKKERIAELIERML